MKIARSFVRSLASEANTTQPAMTHAITATTRKAARTRTRTVCPLRAAPARLVRSTERRGPRSSDLRYGNRSTKSRYRLSSSRPSADRRHRVTPASYVRCMRWNDITEDAPRFAEVAHRRLIDPGVLLVVTVRADGTPRLSPVEPLIVEGDLWLSMMWQSRKASDLRRDDRVLVHSTVTTREGAEGEVKMRGHAVDVDDLEVRARYCDAVAVLGWRPEEPWFHLFRIDIGDVALIRYAQSGDQYVARWPGRTEFVRRATGPTSVGPPQPIVDLFGRR